MTGTEDWRKGFHRALIDAVVSHGSPVADDPSFYGWIHQQYAERIKNVHTVGIDYERTQAPKEDSWEVFMGTFYEGDTRVYGLDLTVVLLDGQTVRFRYQGTLGELISAVVQD